MKSTMKFGRRIGARSAVAAVLLSAGFAGAIEPPPPPPPPGGEPALRGPEVRDRNVPGAPGAFGSEEQLRRQRDRIPPPVFREAVMSLRAEGVPAEVRLSDAQQDAMRRLHEAFEQQRREYMMEHRDEIRALRSEMGGPPPARRRPGQRGEGMNGPEMDGPMMDAPPRGERPAREGMTPEARRAAEQIREIERAGPQPEDLYTKVWEVLSEPQRIAVEAKLDDFRAQRAKEREERYIRQRAPRDRRPEGESPAMEGGPEREMRRPMDGERPRRGGGDERLSPEQRERVDRLLRVFNQLPPEAQEQLLRRLEQRARELQEGRENGRGGPPPRDGDRRRPPERRPPPSMDDVDVPSPGRDGGG